MQFSHHSSNPLEVRTSDSINLPFAPVRDIVHASSEADPLNLVAHEEYQKHIDEDVTRRNLAQETTPKAGPSRVHITDDLVDLESESEDELAMPRLTIKVPSRFNMQTPTKPRQEIDEHAFLNFEDETPGVAVEDRVEGNEGHEGHEQQVEPEQSAPTDVKENKDTQPDDYADYDDYEEEETYDVHDDDEIMHEEEEYDMRLHSDSSHSSRRSSCSSRHSSEGPYSSPVSSRPSSPDEALTLNKRPQEEQDAIADEIFELNEKVPQLKESYSLVDRLGTGTFSSVYKAIDLHYDNWYNKPWLGNHPPDSSAYYQSAGPGYKGRGGRAQGWRNGIYTGRIDEEQHHDNVFVAVKRIYTSSGPERIRNELSIMEDCRGCRHVSQIITAFRHEDQVVIVLPYQRNMDFREFYQDLHPEGIKCYFRCLFRALRDIHARGIIHRDVKPANFLYNPYTGVGTLCDFGLASRMETGSPIGQCLHTPASAKDPHGKNVQLDEAQTYQIKRAQKDARAKSNMPPEKVGVPEQDRRPISKANRAGTRGFRAPEVLFKCTAQTGAIDVWSAGVILLFFLTGKFPIFQSNDDIEGLMEIAVIIGKKNIERAATLHGRTFASNVPDIDPDGLTWRQFVEKMTPDIWKPRKYDMRYYPHNSKHRDGRGSSHMPPPSSSPTSNSGTQDLPIDIDAATRDSVQSDRYANPPSEERHTKEMKIMFSFLESVLHFESTKRYTPQKALYHKFLEEPGVEGDDAFIPNRIGEGRCSEHHYRDEETGVNYVRILHKCVCQRKKGPIFDEEDGQELAPDSEVDEAYEWCGKYIADVRPLEAGEGIAIGNRPCEFHTDSDLYDLDG
ncbi:kinase-like protein [Agrocybe pediades]|nr:kinase-like protein [Agrocybe pediades]